MLWLCVLRILIPLEGAADEQIDFSELKVYSFIYLTQSKVSLCLYGVASPTSLSKGHSCPAGLSLRLWYRLTHTGSMSFRFFSHLLEEDLDQTFLWEIFIPLCLSAFPCRQGELNLILHNPLCWFSSNTNLFLPVQRVKVPHTWLCQYFSSSSCSSYVLLRNISSPGINSRGLHNYS